MVIDDYDYDLDFMVVKMSKWVLRGITDFLEKVLFIEMKRFECYS